MAIIVLIEDNPTNAELMTRLLQTQGHEVHHVERGIDGAKAIRQHNPELVLVDFDLPDMDGRNLIVLFKRRFPDLVIIAVTAHTGAASQSLSYRLGCSAFIGKPFEPKEFLDTVSSYLKTSIPE